MKCALSQITTWNHSPYLGHISVTKRANLDPLVPNFSFDRAHSPTLSPKCRCVSTFCLLRVSETLILVCSMCRSLWFFVVICPLACLPRSKLLNYSAPHTLRCLVNYFNSFIEILAIICTQSSWKSWFIAPPIPVPPRPLHFTHPIQDELVIHNKGSFLFHTGFSSRWTPFFFVEIFGDNLIPK